MHLIDCLLSLHQVDLHLQHMLAKARIPCLAFAITLPIHLRSIIQTADNEGRCLIET
jgi:hypothetical protein